MRVWKERIDKKSGRSYFVNLSTKKTSWKRPAEETIILAAKLPAAVKKHRAAPPRPGARVGHHSTTARSPSVRMHKSKAAPPPPPAVPKKRAPAPKRASTRASSASARSHKSKAAPPPPALPKKRAPAPKRASAAASSASARSRKSKAAPPPPAAVPRKKALAPKRASANAGRKKASGKRRSSAAQQRYENAAAATVQTKRRRPTTARAVTQSKRVFREKFDAKKGKAYYVNVATKKTTWSRPPADQIIQNGAAPSLPPVLPARRAAPKPRAARKCKAAPPVPKKLSAPPAPAKFGAEAQRAKADAAAAKREATKKMSSLIAGLSDAERMTLMKRLGKGEVTVVDAVKEMEAAAKAAKVPTKTSSGKKAPPPAVRKRAPPPRKRPPPRFKFRPDVFSLTCDAASVGGTFVFADELPRVAPRAMHAAAAAAAAGARTRAKSAKLSKAKKVSFLTVTFYANLAHSLTRPP